MGLYISQRISKSLIQCRNFYDWDVAVSALHRSTGDAGVVGVGSEEFLKPMVSLWILGFALFDYVTSNKVFNFTQHQLFIN